MSALYIAIPCYNRRDIAEQCIPTVYAGKGADDRLVIYDDGSQEKMTESVMLMGVADEIVTCESVGVDAQRRQHFLDFMRKPEFDYLYLTDSDSPHAPDYRQIALSLQAEHDSPVCLYRTQTHADYANNIWRDKPHENVIWQRFSPGVSLLLTREHVEKIVAAVPERWSWDWFVPSVLGYRMAVSRVSYCDHIGHLGMHDDGAAPGCVSTERAVNPIPWLVTKRQEILANLGLRDA